jgi:lysozyme family protein
VAIDPTRLKACLAFTLGPSIEGGYVVDDGGPTNHGVTQHILTAYLQRPATIDEVKALTLETVVPIYAELFWFPAKCDLLPAGPDLMHFDACVNMGQGEAVKVLQGAVGIAPRDGAFGPVTALALRQFVNKFGPGELIDPMHDARARAYRADKDFLTDGGDWLRRNDACAKAAKLMVQT